jgi:hypothetical protein
MENTKTKTMEKKLETKTKKLLMVELLKILYNQSYDETVKWVHSGKNKYRMRNTNKEFYKQTSKMLDNQKSNGVKLKDLLDGITDSINN